MFNVGSGESCTIRDVAYRLASALGKDIAPEITGKYRAGDIRHCFADTTRAQAVLRYEPRVLMDDGLLELTDWLEGELPVDRAEAAQAELAVRGLTA